MRFELVDEYEDFNKNLDEGILYDTKSETFKFDFEHDSPDDAIVLKNADITCRQFKGRVYYYGYQLRLEGINSSKLVSFIKEKLSKNECVPEIKKFTYDAINKLHRARNLNKFRCIIYPDSRQNKFVDMIIEKIHSILYDYSEPITYYSIIKNLPEKIEFDWQQFERDKYDELYKKADNPEEEIKRLDKENNTKSRINMLMNDIRHKDFFKLHELGFSVEERKYLRKFLTLDDKSDFSTLENLKNTEQVLLVDDTVTSETTIDEMIRAISVINSDCDIIIFTLIRGKDGREVPL